MSNFAMDLIRNKFNDMMSSPEVTPDNLVRAIREDKSLWVVGQSDMLGLVRLLPPTLINQYVVEIERQYPGGMTGLALEWLKQDQPDYYSIIINKPEGTPWLDRQVNDILKQIGVKR